jgi:hypothetical protein
MTPLEIAVAYLVLSFPGEPHALAVLPMNSTPICWREAREIEARYAAKGQGLQVFAHCVKNETPKPDERQ